jgi:V8-like Glu-specific endopeptidase
MKNRSLLLIASSFALFAVTAIIDGMSFRAQEKQKDDNPSSESPNDRLDDEKKSPTWEEQLDPKTLAIMRRQEALQPAVRVLYEAYLKSPDSGFTGIAFEGDGLALYWKGQLNNDMLAIINQARDIGPVEIIPAAFSLAEMEAEAAKIERAVKSLGGSDIQAIITRFDGSGLDIERMPFDTAEKVSLARVRAGQRGLRTVEQVLAGLDLRIPVHLTTASEPIRLMRTRRNDNSPWRGGGYYRSFRGTQLRGTCSTGFGINAFGRTWVLTAAHCATAPDVAYQGDDKQRMGPVTRENYPHDLILIDAPGSPRIFDGAWNNSSGYSKNVYGWNYTAKDEWVCQSGAASGVVCDLKTGSMVNVSWPQDHPDSDGDWGYPVYGLFSTTQTKGKTAVRPGDSGGPVFSLNGDGVTAKGIVSAGSGTTMYFQDWVDVRVIYEGATPVTP